MTTITYASTSWMLDAACAGIPDFTEAEVAEQRPICAGCPVRSSCLSYALEQPLPNPTYTTSYAGLTPADLVRVAHGGEARPPRVRGPRVRVPKPPAPRKVITATCEVCGTVFEAKSRIALYCSGLCRQRAYVANVKRRATACM